jgi:hypothetical protein
MDNKKPPRSSSSIDHRKSTKVKSRHGLSLFVIVIFIHLELLLLAKSTHGAKSFYLHWNTSNPM